jgi:hypothetical protein
MSDKIITLNWLAAAAITATVLLAALPAIAMDKRWVGRLVPLQEKKVCEGVIKPLAGNYTFGKMDGYVVGLCIFGVEEKAVLGVGKCQESAPCHIEAYVAIAKLPRSFTSEMCNQSLEYPHCYPPFLIRKVISARPARTAPTKLPESIIGLWCFAAADLNDRRIVGYLRNDANAPKPDTPCTKEGDTDWIEFEADGNYHGVEMDCKAVKVTLIDRGVIYGDARTNAVYGLDAHCVSEGDLSRVHARIKIGRGSALTITWRSRHQSLPKSQTRQQPISLHELQTEGK